MRGEVPISRRDMLLGRFAGRIDDVGGATDAPRAAPDLDRSPSRGTPGGSLPLVHRPPGAVDEPDFLAGCTRCGDCIDACPVNAITLADTRYGASAGTPMIDPMSSPCVMCLDTPCIAACEPAVLTAEAPLSMGTASIRTPYCLAYNGSTCTVCSERCPVEDAISVINGRPVVNCETCTGCGVCQYVCPAPYNAVLILPRGGQDAQTRPAAARSEAFDWRGAYFKNRDLRPPQK